MTRRGAPHAGSRPRLTVSVLTRDSEDRLGRLLSEVSAFADEVIVGVDADTVDRTLDVARAHADIVYRFRHPGQMAPARMLPFRYATGDWILSLDDDESIEPRFDTIVSDLLVDPLVSHYWFPRKWVVSLDPCEYLHAKPWYPDWQLRLFRNDPSMIWKPARPHTGYHILGPSCHEERAAILHFEPIWCTPEARQRKLAGYRQAGAQPETEMQFTPAAADVPRRPAELRAVPQPRPRTVPSQFDPTVHELELPGRAPWRSEILSVEMPGKAACGASILVEARVRNTGQMSWAPHMGAYRSTQLNLSYHLLDRSGRMVQWDGQRYHMPRLVPPGDEVTFICSFRAPDRAGEYAIEWDLVSEHECWFRDAGSSVLRSNLEVVANGTGGGLVRRWATAFLP